MIASPAAVPTHTCRPGMCPHRFSDILNNADAWPCWDNLSLTGNLVSPSVALWTNPPRTCDTAPRPEPARRKQWPNLPVTILNNVMLNLWSAFLEKLHVPLLTWFPHCVILLKAIVCVHFSRPNVDIDINCIDEQVNHSTHCDITCYKR